MYQFFCMNSCDDLCSVATPSKKPPCKCKSSGKAEWVTNAAIVDREKPPRQYEHKPMQGFITYVCWECKKPCYFTQSNDEAAPVNCINEWHTAKWYDFSNIKP